MLPYNKYWKITITSNSGKILVKNKVVKWENGDYARDAIIRFYNECSKTQFGRGVLKRFSDDDTIYASLVTQEKHKKDVIDFLIWNAGC